MKFHALAVIDSYRVELERLADERGFFARTWCRRSFEEMGLNPRLRQCSISFNEKCHTLRGLHYQRHPYAEAKLVRCTQGAAYHVVLDLRKESATYLRWSSVTLSAANRDMLYVPEGVAHGFMTLQDATEVFYQMSTFHAPESAAGVRWNDPAFCIDWPSEAAVISKRDGSYADYVAGK